jgi:hypothetical protein
MKTFNLAAACAASILMFGCTEGDSNETSASSEAEETASFDPMQSALSAGPADVIDAATVLGPDGNVLREGDNDWTCIAETPGMGPMCNDAVWMEALTAMQSGGSFPTGKFGVSYMLAGEGGAPGVSNLDPAATEPTEDNMWIKDGPHMMVILPDPSLYESMSNNVEDPVYVMWKDTPFAHLMIRLTDAE